jgi:hypothetical protein
LPSSALRRRASRRFTPLRVEWLERREVLTAIDLATINVTADAHSYTEGQTAWFTFTLAKPAPQAFQLDLLLSGGPAGPTGYVLPIAQGETAIHVDFPTDDNVTPGDSYTLNLAITGSSQTGPSPAGPFDSAATRVLDNDGIGAPLGPASPGSFLESFSGPSGPTGPSSLIINEPDDAYEGTPFQITGTISPPGDYPLNHWLEYDYGGFEYDYLTGSFSVWLLIPDDGPSPGNDTPSDVTDVEMLVWGEDPEAAVSAEVQVTVHNVNPGFYNEYGQFLIDIYDYPPGGPDFVVSGLFYDPGSPDDHEVTIDWGDGSAPTVFVPINDTVAATHRYVPDGLDHTITITVEDDDTGSGTYVEEISMYLLDLDNDADK